MNKAEAGKQAFYGQNVILAGKLRESYPNGCTLAEAILLAQTWDSDFIGKAEHFARDSELKVYKDKLKACVHAFNLLPNTRLGFQGLNNTYALASEIDSLLEHEKKNI